jgi:hypothetical protein
MQINADALRDALLHTTDRLITIAKGFKECSPEQLNHKASPDRWSVLECLEHLNLYGDFYLPAIERQMAAHPAATPGLIFKSGTIGNYFAGLMKGRNGAIKKMKSPPDKNPANSALSTTTIDRFIKQQEKMKALLQRSRTADLTRVKVPITLTRLIRLRLGDTFRFVVYHNERHMAQAQRCIILI